MKRKFLSVLLVFALIFTFIPAAILTVWAVGDITLSVNSYALGTAEMQNSVRYNVKDLVTNFTVGETDVIIKANFKRSDFLITISPSETAAGFVMSNFDMGS